MKLLFLDQFSDLGGGQRMLLDVLAAVRSRGWSGVVAMPGEGSMFEQVRGLGFETARLDCATTRIAMVAPALAGVIRDLSESCGMVYINGPRLLPAVALARVAQPVLFHAHIEVSPYPARLVAGAALATLNARAIAVCEMVAAAWRPFIKRLSVVYNGVAGPSQLAVSRSGPTRIGCIGRISPEKGQLEFLAAARRISAAVPGAEFVIAGAPLFQDRAASNYEREVRASAAGLPVTFTGWVDDVYGVMRSLDLLLVPSVWRESNPRVILEAFAAGLPVIAFRAGGIPEIIEHGRNGFLCDTVEEMAALAVELLRSGQAEEISRRARASWRERFTLERFQNEVLSVIESSVALLADR
jgi:glycosyltransferase involved in cell wall biosynthesis